MTEKTDTPTNQGTPDFVDVPELSINLAESSVLVIRRMFKDKKSAPLGFILSARGDNGQTHRTPPLTFAQILELREAMGQVIDSVVAGSARRFEKPVAGPDGEKKKAAPKKRAAKKKTATKKRRKTRKRTANGASAR